MARSTIIQLVERFYDPDKGVVRKLTVPFITMHAHIHLSSLHGQQICIVLALCRCRWMVGTSADFSWAGTDGRSAQHAYN